MKKIIPFWALLFCLLLTGCRQHSARDGVDFPFDAEEVVSVDAYYYQENFTNSARKKVVTDTEKIQYLYFTFNSLSIQVGPIDPDWYGANISAYRFHLADGTSYELVYEGYGVKQGVLTAQDMMPHLTSADVNGIWANLTADAEGCPEEELPVPYQEEPAVEITAPKVYTGEEAEVHQLIFDFLALKQVDFVSEVNHSVADYLAPELRDILEEQLFWKVFRFEKLVRSSIREKILWEEFGIHISDLQINGETARVFAFDTYEYELSDANGIVSSRGTGYTFTCRKDEGTWYITGIDTDNELIEGHVEGYSADELPALAGVSE